MLGFNILWADSIKRSVCGNESDLICSCMLVNLRGSRLVFWSGRMRTIYVAIVLKISCGKMMMKSLARYGMDVEEIEAPTVLTCVRIQ